MSTTRTVGRTVGRTPSRPVTFLVVAKAPHPGRVKTRLAHDLAAAGLDVQTAERTAADLAAACLLDTLEACTGAAALLGGASLRLALDGALPGCASEAAVTDALVGWEVVGQTDGDLGARLAAAHADVVGAVVQVGMDTPQATAEQLAGLARGVVVPDRDAEHGYADAVLAPAADGGWWALALRTGALGAPLSTVTMSTPTVCADTRRAFEASGLRMDTGPVLVDVDHLDDAHRVATEWPDTRLARALADTAVGVS